MKKRISILIGLLTVGCCFLTCVALAGPPPDPPREGGIPYCEENLIVCTDDLDSCTESVNTCTTELYTCETDFGICTAELFSTNDDLQTCTTDLGACDSSMQTCTSILTQTSDLLEICELDLSACLESEVRLPATGQVTCWTQAGEFIDCDVEAGEDGYYQAGAEMAFIWHEDGTLEDVNTRLMWERKDMSGGVHDSRNGYRWVESFRQHIYALNNTCQNDETIDCSENGDADCETALGAVEVCGFAGYRDWRMPNAKEMITIIDYGSGTSHPMSFDWNCEEGCSSIGPDWTACSCVEGRWTWTSTTYLARPDHAYFRQRSQIMHGYHADPTPFNPLVTKLFEMGVRAVRRGL